MSSFYGKQRDFKGVFLDTFCTRTRNGIETNLTELFGVVETVSEWLEEGSDLGIRARILVGASRTETLTLLISKRVGLNCVESIKVLVFNTFPESLSWCSNLLPGKIIQQ